MSSKLNRVAAVLLAVVAICSCHALRPRTASTLIKSFEKVRGLGLIEHRGKFYRLEDLMDPAYRAASSEKFVREFGATNVANLWAGTNPEDNLRRQRCEQAERLRLEPWAGLDSRIWSGRDSHKVGD